MTFLCLARISCVVVLATLIMACNSGTQAGSIVAATEGLTKPDIIKTIASVMVEFYGDDFNKDLDCWDYEIDLDGDSTDYCMAIGGWKIIDTNRGQYLYYFSRNVSNSSVSSKYIYSHNDPGLMGAFEIKLEQGNGWSLEAASPAMEYGSVGNCGCRNARFFQLGDGKYGWLFKSGGTWQGETIVYHSIVTPIGKSFKDVSAIPVTESGQQDVTYSIRFDSSKPDVPMYPLLVTRSIHEGSKEEFLVPYDIKNNEYRIKEGQK